MKCEYSASRCVFLDLFQVFGFKKHRPVPSEQSALHAVKHLHVLSWRRLPKTPQRRQLRTGKKKRWRKTETVFPDFSPIFSSGTHHRGGPSVARVAIHRTSAPVFLRGPPGGAQGPVRTKPAMASACQGGVEPSRIESRGSLWRCQAPTLFAALPKKEKKKTNSLSLP